MKRIIIAVWAVHRRNTKLLWRQKQLIIAPFLLPLVLMILTALIMGGIGDEWPIAVIDEESSHTSEALLQTLEESESNITPYFSILETDLPEARQLVKDGQLHMLVRIPNDYTQTKTLYTETFNINTDMMKNTRLRLEHAVIEHMQMNEQLSVYPVLITERPDDIWRVAYISGSTFLLALMFSATIVAANLFAFDRENRTRKEILLTPINPAFAGIGMMLTSVTIAILSSLLALFVAVAAFRLEIHFVSLLTIYAGMLPILIFCAGFGILIAHWLKRFRVFQPVIIVTFIATFFVSGGFAGTAVLPEGARLFSQYWPFSYVFQWFNPILHGFQSSLLPYQYTLLILAGMLAVLIIPPIYKREMNEHFGGGQ